VRDFLKDLVRAATRAAVLHIQSLDANESA
jgi:hypothetical protein